MHFSAIRSIFFTSVLVLPLHAQEAISLPASQEVHRPEAARQGHGTARFGGRIVPYVVVDGLAVAEGDIVLGPAAEIEAARDEPGSGEKANRKDSNVVVDPRLLWPDGVVPYVIHPDLEIPARVEQAIAEFADLTPIRLVERTDERDYVEFLPSTGCSAAVGRRGGRQSVNLSRFCDLGAVIHEIGHAVGLWHEQARADRDRFVTIDETQIDRVFLGNFPRTSDSAGRPAGPYDFDSIMHYSSYGFSIGGKVIETIPPGIPIGQRVGLSPGDVREVRALYGDPQSGVTIATAPAGLRVLVDGEIYDTPVTFDWAEGEQHAVEIPSPQQVSPIKRFLFGRWADDAPQRRTVTVGAGGDFLLAAMIEQNRHDYRSTSQALGQVIVEPSPEDGFHTLRSEIQLTAAPSDDAYFLGWSGVGEFYKHGLSLNPIEFVLRSDRYRLRAFFSRTKPVEIGTNDPGRRIRVDGGSVPLPFNTTWRPGEVHRLHVDRSEAATFSPAIQSVFENWEDGSSMLNREVVVDEEGSGFHAEFSREFNLDLSSVPIQGGEVLVVPRPNGAYVPEGQTVTLAAAPEDGFIFSGWFFDVGGRQPEQTFTMDRQYSILGFFIEGEQLEIDEPVALKVGPAARSVFHHNYVEIPPDAQQVEVKLETLTPDSVVRLYVRQFEPPTGSPDGVIADARDLSEEPLKTLVLTREDGLRGGPLYISPVNGTVDLEIETRVTVTVTGGAPLPVIQSNKGAMTFVTDSGGDPAPQRMVIRNIGGGELRFAATTETPWLDVTPNEAASITIQGFPLNVSINDTDMEPGTYEGSVILQRLDRLPRKIPTQELRNRTEIPVTLVVNAPAGAAPSISEGALVNAADLSSNLGLGALLTLFGENFASNSAAVRALPYPNSLSGVTVELDGEAVPLQFVSENQINLQAPIFANFFEPIPLRVLRDFVPSETIMVQLELAAPGLFRDPSTGVAVAVRAVDGSLVSAENPALPDEVLTFYGTGIGLTLEQPPDGAAASTRVVSEALFPVEATIGGRPALVEFAGLAPGFVGLAQLNVRVPADVLPGESAVVVDVLGVESVPAPLPIGAR